MSQKIGGIILAAGESRRLGRAKQLLEYKGQFLLDRTVGFFEQLLLRETCIVYGARANELQPNLDNFSCLKAYNQDWQTGMGSSVRTGLTALLKVHPDLDAVLLALVDHPLVTATHYSALLEMYKEHSGRIIATLHDQSYGVPAILPKFTFSDLLSQNGKAGAKKIIKKYQDLVVPFTCPEAAFDIDTEADYQRLLSL